MVELYKFNTRITADFTGDRITLVLLDLSGSYRIIPIEILQYFVKI